MPGKTRYCRASHMLLHFWLVVLLNPEMHQPLSLNGLAYVANYGKPIL